MKKIISVLIISILSIFLLTACAETGTESSTKIQSKTTIDTSTSNTTKLSGMDNNKDDQKSIEGQASVDASY